MPIAKSIVIFFKDPLHNFGEAVAVGSGWAARRLFAANSTAIGNKNNAADRPSPADHRPEGVVQSVPNSVDAGVFSAMRQRIELTANAIIARPIKAATLTICIGLCNGYWVAVYASNVENNWSPTLILLSIVSPLFPCAKCSHAFPGRHRPRQVRQIPRVQRQDLRSAMLATDTFLGFA